MCGGWLVEEFLLDGAPAEPGDRAKAPGDGGAAAGFQVACLASMPAAAGGEQPRLVLLAPGCLLAQVPSPASG
jgi:hypothetical protein